MRKTKILIKERLVLDNEAFEVHLSVIAVPKGKKYPDGHKVRCALVERETGVLRVLLDNHEPFGYHLHAKLPENKNFRVLMELKDYQDAVRFFMREVKRIINNEK